MECGHIGQNVSLQAVSLGLDTVMVGAFDDERVREVLSIPQEETPLYIIPVGYSAE
jgi:nitroreductase